MIRCPLSVVRLEQTIFEPKIPENTYKNNEIEVMEEFVQLLQSSDIKTRQHVAEQLLEKLKQKSAIEYLPAELRRKVLNCVLTLARENHVKLCLTGLECLQTLVEIHTDAFQSYMNVTFDTIINKFADVKVLNVCFCLHALS